MLKDVNQNYGCFYPKKYFFTWLLAELGKDCPINQGFSLSRERKCTTSKVKMPMHMTNVLPLKYNSKLSIPKCYNVRKWLSKD